MKEALIDSEADKVGYFMSHDEEVGSPLKGREESSHSKQIDSKESSNLLEGKDAKTGLGSSPSIRQLEGLLLKLRKPSS